MEKYTAIDLFCGAGGLHIGFENAGFNIKLCVDNNDIVEKTHKRNFPNIPIINRDIYGAQNEAYMSWSAEKWVRGLCFNELGVGG